MIPFATLVVDEDGRIVFANQLAEVLLGYGRMELLHRPIENLIPDRFRQAHEVYRAGYMVAPATREMGGKMELRALHRNGREFPVEVALRSLPTGDGRYILTTIRDITCRVVEREQLRELSERLITMNDEQRAQLARAIHDELGQLLTGVKMDVAWLQRHLSDDQEALLQKMEQMSELLDSGVEAVRSLSADLRPGILDDFGLEAAVEWQVAQFQERTEIPCTYSSKMEGSAPAAGCANAVFYVLKEALTNIARHAQADHVDVQLHRNPDRLLLVVRDDGRGISNDEIYHPRSIGLLGMRERARICGGSLQIVGARGQGSTITLRLQPGAAEEERDG